MPRKAGYQLDYDGGYDDYDDAYEDYDEYDDAYEEKGQQPVVSKPAVRTDVWSCSICTYDNDETMSFCDICGVIRAHTANTGVEKIDSPPVEKKSIKAQPIMNKVDVPSKVRDQDSTWESNGSSLMGGRSSVHTSNIRDSNYDTKAPSTSRSSAGSSAVTAIDGQNSRNKTSFLGVGDRPENITSSISSITIKETSESSKQVMRGKAIPPAQYTPEKWMLPDAREDALAQLNLAIVGHVDSGKSTLSGRLLHLLGEISQKVMHKYEKEAKTQGKGSFAYAWALDESTEERERGITMTVAVAYFDTKRYHVVVLDSPGHKDFVPNMISGATQADAAILVIDASVGSFEVGMDATGGQTREHAQLIRSFGVEQIIVAVNKMDVVQYSNERFELVKRQLGSFLRSCNFKDSLVSWVPLSAMENQNMVAPATDVRLKSWYRGPHLLEAIDSLHPPTREYMKPLLMPICDVIRSHSTGQVSACGKLDAGALRGGCKVLVMPLGEIGTVRSIERNAQACSIARAGDNVSVTIQGIDFNQVMAGGVLCHPDFSIRVATRLELKVLVLDVVTPILIGSQLEFHIHHAKDAARIARITSLLDPKTGKVTKKSPRCLLSKQNAVLEVVLQGGVCAEEFSKCKPLGRVFLRTSGRTIALGVVTQIIE